MSQTAEIALLAWPVISLVFFAVLGPWRGVITSYLGAYLLLSNRVLIPMSGIPDYMKYTAANLAVMAGIMIFDAGRIRTFRLRWYDLPALLLLASPVISFILNGLPFKNGVTAVSNMSINWVIPYFVGRLYCGTPGADRELALGFTIAGALMAPLIAFEVLTESSISGILYGIRATNGYKSGLYRPVVMGTNALETALWATLAALPAFMLWTTRSGPKMLGLPFAAWTAAAFLGALLCAEKAALGFLAMGVMLIAMTVGRRRFGQLPEGIAAAGAVAVLPATLGLKTTLIVLLGIGAARYLRDHRPRVVVYAAVLLTPVYLVLRLLKAIPQSFLTRPAYALMGAERGESFQFRFVMENRMITHLMQRPFFGWATLEDRRGYAPGVRILDSLWIIQAPQIGIVGLAAFYTMLCLPSLRTARARPIETWQDPRNAAAVGLAIALIFYTYDSLLNAYTMFPMPMTAGFLMGLPAAVGAARARFMETAADRRLDQVDRLATHGRADEAEALCRRLIAVREADPAGRASLADACDRLADLREALGRPEEADPIRRRALGVRIALAGSSPGDPGPREALAGCAERLARSLASRGRPAEAAEIREMALEQRAALAAADPDDREALARYTDGLNDLAWLLSVGGDPSMHDPGRAAALAEQAVRLRPDCKSYWNTLSASYHRSGDPGSALAALNQSLRIGPDEVGFDEVLRSLALAALGDLDGAREAIERVDALMGDGGQAPGSLLRLRAEAAEALAGPAPAAAR